MPPSASNRASPRQNASQDVSPFRSIQAHRLLSGEAETTAQFKAIAKNAGPAQTCEWLSDQQSALGNRATELKKAIALFDVRDEQLFFEALDNFTAATIQKHRAEWVQNLINMMLQKTRPDLLERVQEARERKKDYEEDEEEKKRHKNESDDTHDSEEIEEDKNTLKLPKTVLSHPSSEAHSLPYRPEGAHSNENTGTIIIE